MRSSDSIEMHSSWPWKRVRRSGKVVSSLEDFADEWVTKAIYHYRWTYDPDIEKAGKLLPLDRDLKLSDDAHAAASDFIIEDSYRNVLDILHAHLAQGDFLFGDRPGRTDFALYGQLKPLVWWDPTPMAIAVERASRAVNWIERVDDLSWLPVDGDIGWSALDDLEATVRDLLTEAGRTSAPFMLANDEALVSGADVIVCEIEGAEYRQGPFKYQGKCLQWLREAHADLAADDRARVDGVLAGTGCETLFA